MQAQADEIASKVMTILEAEFQASKRYQPEESEWLGCNWAGFMSPSQHSRVRNTGARAGGSWVGNALAVMRLKPVLHPLADQACPSRLSEYWAAKCPSCLPRCTLTSTSGRYTMPGDRWSRRVSERGRRAGRSRGGGRMREVQLPPGSRQARALTGTWRRLWRLPACWQRATT